MRAHCILTSEPSLLVARVSGKPFYAWYLRVKHAFVKYNNVPFLRRLLRAFSRGGMLRNSKCRRQTKRSCFRDRPLSGRTWPLVKANEATLLE